MASMRYELDDDTILEIEREVIEYSTALPQPDPRWRAVDSNGHEHAYAEGTDHYPTLKPVFGEPYWCEDCNGEHQDSWLVCRECGEKVTPGTRVDTSIQRMPGRTEYLLNGEPIPESRAQEILADMRERGRP